ncbi:151R [Invertebrate iridescent virus Kaz2018]|uniref:Uncharacterized protein n=1 Tax=Iridovirus sp. TaxID=135728 RepID=A0AAU7YCJ2_9VIRU|nr:151R [Invertebrate iridescent virus Kaz2018]
MLVAILTSTSSTILSIESYIQLPTFLLSERSICKIEITFIMADIMLLLFLLFVSNFKSLLFLFDKSH